MCSLRKPQPCPSPSGLARKRLPISRHYVKYPTTQPTKKIKGFHTKPMLHFIFLLKPCKPTLQKSARQSLKSYLCCSLCCTAGLRQVGGYANLLFFLIDEIQSRHKKMKRWACNAVAAASYSLMIEVH